MAAGQWSQRRGSRGACPRLGRRLKALDLLSGGRPLAGRTRAGGLGGRRPSEKGLAQEIVAAGGPDVRDLTGTDLRNGVLAMAAAGVAISNDSGLMHIAAAIGTPTMGIFGPTSPYLWAPLNGLAATVVQDKSVLSCQPCQSTICKMNDHRCMRDIAASEVVAIAQRVLSEAGARVTT
ncbi:hypothetical protein BRDID11002_78690 [Bradyrhizobium diazoefficiens]